jgi:phosphoglycerate dehydrogenase-like enzyme
MADREKIVFVYAKTHVPQLIIDAAKEKLPAGFELTFCPNDTPDEERRAEIASADHLMAYATAFDDIDAVGKATLLQLLSAGYDRIDLDACRAKGVAVANNGGANAPTVAEHAILLMLSVYKKVPLHHNAMQAGEWLGPREGLSMRELRDKQVGIIGFGKIGQNVARMANGFLATVAYADVQSAPSEVEAELKATRMELDALLKTSDIVTLHTFLDESTRGMINADALRHMKKTAILINTSRGPVVDQAALIEALDAGEIMGAGLDVFEKEPLEADSPLLGRDNVILSPHNAGTTLDTWTRRIDNAFANFQRVSRGEDPLWVVNG